MEVAFSSDETCQISHIIYINQSPVTNSLSTELEVLTVCLLKM